MLSRTLAVTAAAAALSGSAMAQALAEPPPGKVELGIGFQSDPGYFETPAQLNEKYGFNFAAFQLSQPIPVPAYDYVTGVGGPAPVALVGATGTDANVYLTVYPNQGLAAVTDADILSLAIQIRTIQGDGRTVFLRWAPEFSGNWMIYGLQPTAFKQVWSRMYSIIKSEAPDTVVVWSPNTGYSYPFGATLASVPDAADRAALDTNGDGQLTNADDPYSPWYPGDDQVDWIGISLYFKGPDFQNINEIQVSGFVYDIIHGYNPYYKQRGQTNPDFYELYCAQKPTKACMFSEAAAAWHSNADLVASARNTQVELQRAWWSDIILNQSFWEQHPRMKAYYHFEYDKFENDGGVVDERDYRLSNNSDVLNAFLADLAPVQDLFVYANSTIVPGQPAVNTTAFEITPSGPIATATVTVSNSPVTATYTQFFSGPYVNASFVGTADPLASATGTSTLSGMATERGIPGFAAPSQSAGSNVFRGSASSSLGSPLGALLAGAAAGLFMLFR